MQLIEALASFTISRTASGLSRNTIDWYEIMIRQFDAWLKESDLPSHIVSITPDVIDAFLAAQRAKHAPATVLGRYLALSALFNWLVERERHRGAAQGREPLLLVSPVAGVQKPPSPRREPRRAKLEDLASLLDSIKPLTWIDLRDRLVIRFLFWSGLRVGELAGLDVDDIDLTEETIHVRKGKGDKDRAIPLHPSLRIQILESLVNRPHTHDPALILSSWGDGGVRGRLSANGMRQMLKRRASRAGLRYWNPHSYRHAAAMKLLNDGQVELGIVSKILGHSSPEITRRVYADFTDSSVKKAYADGARRLGKLL